ncbi:MAG: hypothetical protein ACUVXI_03460 [bacterium]
MRYSLKFGAVVILAILVAAGLSLGCKGLLVGPEEKEEEETPGEQEETAGITLETQESVEALLEGGFSILDGFRQFEASSQGADFKALVGGLKVSQENLVWVGPTVGPDDTDGWYYADTKENDQSVRLWVKFVPAWDPNQGPPKRATELRWVLTDYPDSKLLTISMHLKLAEDGKHVSGEMKTEFGLEFPLIGGTVVDYVLSSASIVQTDHSGEFTFHYHLVVTVIGTTEADFGGRYVSDSTGRGYAYLYVGEDQGYSEMPSVPTSGEDVDWAEYDPFAIPPNPQWTDGLVVWIDFPNQTYVESEGWRWDGAHGTWDGSKWTLI